MHYESHRTTLPEYNTRYENGDTLTLGDGTEWEFFEASGWVPVAVRPVTNPVTGGIGIRLSGGSEGIIPASAHAQRLIRKMQESVEDTHLLVVGDSTGNGSDEWVYQFALWLCSMYPAWSVDYRLWNDASGNYDAAVALQTSGARKLTIWNCSVSGTKPEYVLGSRYANAVAAVPSVDLLIVNHGHNMTNQIPQTQVAMQYLELTEPVLLTHPGAGVILVAQNPEMETTDNDIKARAAREAAALRGFGIAEVWDKFVSLGKSASLYVTTDTPGDTKHPSPEGTALFVEAVKEHFVGISIPVENPVSLLERFGGENLLSNGNFATWTTTPGAPDGWTAANATVTKDTSIKYGKNQYSCKIEATGAGQPLIRQDLSANELAVAKGRWLILCVAVYVPISEDQNGGRIGMLSNSNGSNNYTPGNAYDGWRWKFLPVKIATSDTYARAQLYANTATTAGKVAYFGEAYLRYGRYPIGGPR